MLQITKIYIITVTYFTYVIFLWHMHALSQTYIQIYTFTRIHSRECTLHNCIQSIPIRSHEADINYKNEEN